jgi:hypothetical protein
MRFMTSPRRVAYRRTGAAGPTRPPGQRLVHEADPDLPISNLQPLEALAGVSPFDWVAFGSAAGLAIVMAGAGSLVPAMRAVHVDPLTAIRHE